MKWLRHFLLLLVFLPELLFPLCPKAHGQFTKTVRNGKELYVSPGSYVSIQVVDAPVNPTDVVNKAYADLIGSGGASLNNVGSNCATVPAGTASRSCRIGVWTFNGSALPAESVADYESLIVTGSGVDLGNQGGASVRKATSTSVTSYVRGITQDHAGFINCRATGDCIASYEYIEADGGESAASDETIGAYDAELNENGAYFRGTAPVNYGVGALNIDPTYTSGNPWTTDGTYFINTSRDVLTATQSGASVPIASSTMADQSNAIMLNYLPLSTAALPVTTTWAYAFGQPVTFPNGSSTITATQSISVTKSFTVQPIAGVYTPLPSSGVVCLASDIYPEMATITASGPMNATSHVQSVTMSLRNPHEDMAIFVGGACGRFVSFDADSLTDTPTRQLFYVYGSLTGSDLIYGDSLFGYVTGPTIPYAGMIASKAGPNALHIFHGAEIVANRTAGANPTLEPNNMDIEAGDTLEDPHFPHVGFKGIGLKVQVTTPCTASGSCDFLGFTNAALGGFTFGANYFRTRNGVPESSYLAGGGKRIPGNGWKIEGPIGTVITMSEAPQGNLPGGAGGGIISVGASPNGNEWHLVDTDSTYIGFPETGTYAGYVVIPKIVAGTLTQLGAFTGTCPAGSSLTIAGGIVTGCGN